MTDIIRLMAKKSLCPQNNQTIINKTIVEKQGMIYNYNAIIIGQPWLLRVGVGSLKNNVHLRERMGS